MFSVIRSQFTGLILLAGITLLGTLSSAGGAVGIEASAEPTDLYQGETVTVTLRVSGFKEGMEPDLTRMPASSVVLMGQTDQSFQNITLINGKRQVNSFSGRIFQYRITPDHTGSYNLGPIHVTEAGKSLASVPGPVVTIHPIPQQDIVQLFLESSKTSVILDEPFTVSLRIRIRRLPVPYDDVSPLPENAPPFLDIPYLTHTEDNGLECENIEQRLNAMLAGNGETFRINSFSLGGDPFGGMFGQQQQARFHLDRQAISHKGIPCFEYTFALGYTPQREGTYHFGPVIFKGQTFVRVTPQGEGQTEMIYAIADAVDVDVTPPPEEGRPPTYIGAIGSNLTVSASLDTQTCFVGDPLTLTVEMGGDVRLDNITAPRLSVQEALSRDFRIYEDTVQRESEPKSRRYRFTIRPTKAGTLEFPPVCVSYYDTATSAYRRLYTEPIPVRANAVTEVQSDSIINSGERSITIGANSEKNLANFLPAPVVMTANMDAAETFFHPRLHIPLLLAGPLIYIIVMLFRLLNHYMPQLRRYKTRRSAAATALHQIRQTCNATDNAGLQVAQALRGYLQNHGGERVKAATPDECEQILQSIGISDDLSYRFAHCLNDCSNAAFAGKITGDIAPADTDLQQEGAFLITAIENALKQKRRHIRHRRTETVLTVALLLLTFTAPIYANLSSPDSSSFEAQRAINALLTASQPNDFSKAAEALAALMDQGAANSALFYNYGTARLLANEPVEALEALTRAERYSGTTWDIRRNMLLAQHAINEDAPLTLPWYRIPLFWHFRLPATQRMTLTALAFLLIWVAALLRDTRLREMAIAALWITIGIFLLFGASTLSSAYAEHHAAITHAQRLPSVYIEPLEDKR